MEDSGKMRKADFNRKVVVSDSQWLNFDKSFEPFKLYTINFEWGGKTEVLCVL